MGGSLRCGPCLRWRPPASLRWSPAAGMIWYKRAGSPPQRRSGAPLPIRGGDLRRQHPRSYHRLPSKPLRNPTSMMAAIGWRLQSHANPTAEHEERLVAVQESGDDDGAGGYNGGMADHIRVIKHEAVPKCGSYEVRFPDGTESRFFYWDDLPSRRTSLWAICSCTIARTGSGAGQGICAG